MEVDNLIPCAKCGNSQADTHPFCPECGALQPALVLPGAVSVVLDEVPAQTLRARVVRVLQSWFPEIDSFQADAALKGPASLLVRGIDEDSARRITAALQALKVGAHLKKGDSGFRDFFNGGLAISGVALILLPFVGSLTAFFLVLAAIAAPVIGAVRKQKRMRPLVSVPRSAVDREELVALAGEYGDLMARLGQEEAATLKAITRSVFQVRDRLANRSLVATAAGEVHGALYERLLDLIRASVELGRKITLESGQRRDALKRDLDSLDRLVRETDRWFREMESGERKEVPELYEDIQSIRDNIDTILQEVRVADARPQREKIPLR